MRYAEAEKKVHEEDDMINNLAVLVAMKSTDDPAPRNGAPKGRKNQKPPIVESDIIAESPGPSPSDGRAELMKRVKGTSQRSSSTASQTRAPAKEEIVETNRGLIAERAGQLIVGAEVFYKWPKGTKDAEGEGIHCLIRKVWQDRKPVQYDIREPEEDQAGPVRKATGRELVPILATAATLPIFPTGSKVYAKYPETDTFYNAEVRTFTKGMYTLMFEGEDDNKEQAVDKRYVLDSRLK